MDSIFFIMIALILLLLLFAAYKCSTLWDSIIVSNVCCTIISLGILLYALVTKNDFYADTAVVFVLTGFVGTQFYALFILRRGNM